MEEVKEFLYLGSIIPANGSCNAEIYKVIGRDQVEIVQIRSDVASRKTYGKLES